MMDYYSAIKRNKTVPFSEIWVDLETFIQNEMSERENQILHINTYIWHLENSTDKPICKAEIETQKVLVTQLCLTVCDPVDCSPPRSSVHGILQARILQWLAIPSPGDLPDPGIKPGSPSCIAGRFFTVWATREDAKRDTDVENKFMDTK